ncbi:MAG: hypothetical protein PVJ10_07630 [Thiohalophilus sp.]|jgi:hypothetical protein
MNSQFNYSTFIEMFLQSDDEHEPYGVAQSATPQHPRTLETAEDDVSVSPPS